MFMVEKWYPMFTFCFSLELYNTVNAKPNAVEIRRVLYKVASLKILYVQIQGDYLVSH